MFPAVPTVVGDFDGDGKLDVQAYAGVLLGNGDGTFHLLQSAYVAAGSVTADFNGDGVLDLADDRGGVWLGVGDGTFQRGGSYQPPAGLSGYGVALSTADLDGDGLLDLVGRGSFGDYGGGISDPEMRVWLGVARTRRWHLCDFAAVSNADRSGAR